MQKPEIWRLVLQRLVPGSGGASWADWEDYVQICLAPEVRHEARRFYGHNDGLEAQHSGLDYVQPSTRLRLSAFPHHLSLFRAIDALRLSDDDVHSLCRWRGTKYAKDRYERRHKVQIVDTTWQGVQEYTTPRPTVTFVGHESIADRHKQDDLAPDIGLAQPTISAMVPSDASDSTSEEEMLAAEHEAWETLQHAFADCDFDPIVERAVPDQVWAAAAVPS